MYKRFKPEDIQYVQQNVSAKITLDGNSGGVKTTTYHSESLNEHTKSYYNSINQLFYKRHDHGGNSVFTGRGVYYSYSEDRYDKKQFKNKFPDRGVMFSISSSKYGRSIKPGTLKLTDTTEPYSITIQDDGNGNLYPTNAQISQSGTTSISSSDNYVGNIFYEHGLVTLTETESFAGAWDLDTSLLGEGPDMSSENNLPHGIFFKPDGTRYYMIGSQGSKEGVYEYSMTTAWDVSTATYTGNYFDISHYSADAWRSISFKPDGTRLFLTNEDSDSIKAYDLDIAWDLSSFDVSDFGSIETFNLDGAAAIVENKVKGHYFREDGLKLYIVGETKNSAIEYNLSTAFDLTSIAGNPSQSFDISSSVSPVETEINGIHFKPDGTRMYTGGNDNNVVYEHILSTPWDVSTATFNTSESINSEDTQIHDVKWKPDGSKMYIVGHGSDKVHQYQHSASFYSNLGTNYTASYERKKLIRTWTWTCVVDPSEFNFTMNPTIINSGSFEVTKIDDSRKYRPEISGTFKENHYHSMSIVKLPLAKNHIPEKFRKRSFSPYITKIGLMNDKRELLCIAALPIPIKKTKDNRLVFKIQMDF